MSKDFPGDLREALPAKARVAEARKMLEKKGVKYVFCCWIDLLGIPKTKPVPLAEWENLCQGRGPQFAVHSVSMVPDAGPADPDQIMVPDLDSLVACPWDNEIAWVIADLYEGDGTPYTLCPRTALRRQIKRAKDAGYRFFMGFEPEVIILRPLEDGTYAKAFDDQPPEGRGWRAARQAFGYDAEFSADSIPFLGQMIDLINGLGWGLKDVVCEGAYSQYEFDFGYSDALTTADRFVFFRFMIKEVAKTHGLVATMMPKPTTGDWRSGSHINASVQSVRTPGQNLLEGKGGGWSPLAYNMVAGLIKHGAALSGLTLTTVNSYKGMVDRVPGFEGGTVTWAPTHITYGSNNRSAMFRFPQARRAIENRAADLTMNSYLAFAMTMAASLEGITKKMKAPAPTEESLYDVDPAKLAKAGVEHIPETLMAAVRALVADPLAKEALGERLFHGYIRYKQDEWRRFYTTVTEWERREYLRFY